MTDWFITSKYLVNNVNDLKFVNAFSNISYNKITIKASFEMKIDEYQI